MKKDPLIDKLLHFFTHSPTAFHAVEETRKQFLKAGFKELRIDEEWILKKGHPYFLCRDGAMIAFVTPTKELKEVRVLASHTDSPALKLKPRSEFVKEGMVMLGVEVYGGPLLSSWLNRDLGIAGKIFFSDKKGKLQEALVNLTTWPVTIPQLAIHLDRKVNDEGLLLNKQEHLAALASAHQGKQDPAFLLNLISTAFPIDELVGHDLLLYPLEAPRRIGKQGEFIAAYRIDSLASVHAITQALLDHPEPLPHRLKMATFWDHEEIGSGTATGAGSPLFSNLLERIGISLGGTRETYLRLIPHSLTISVDLWHAVNPNYPEKHDPQHKVELGQGVLIKTNAQKRYASDLSSMKPVLEAARKAKIPHTQIAGRNDIPSGSTIGPIQASQTGMPTVDVGIGQLSMHSTRELMRADDYISLHKFLSTLLT